MEFFKSLLAGAVAGASGGSGSSVIANPTLEGTEAALSGLEVDGTKYKVESGGGSAAPLYLHVVQLKSSGVSNSNIYCSVVNKTQTPFTRETFGQYIRDIGCVRKATSDGGKAYPASGGWVSGNALHTGLFWNNEASDLYYTGYQLDSNGSLQYSPGQIQLFFNDSVSEIN